MANKTYRGEKMKKKIMAILLGIIGVVFSISDAYALENDSTVVVEYPGTIYGYHYKNGVLRSYGRVPFRYQNGTLAYCIEPYVGINVNTYSSTNDWSITGYSNDVKRQMELISYYGYEYPGHNTLNYYLATQELIWLFNDDYVKFMDDYSEDGSLGNQINTENEKAEILRLVNNHNKLPVFANMWNEEKLGTVMNLSDTNAALVNYDVTGTTKFEKNNNKLKIYLDTFGMHIIYFKKIANNNRQTTVYYYNGYSQMMASFGMNDTIEANLHIEVRNAKVRINKKDTNGNLITNNNAIFNIKNIDTNKYVKENIATNNNGYIQLTLSPGNYSIEELNAPSGYVINKEDIVIHINNNINLINGEYNVDIYNDNPKGKIIVNKTDEDGNILKGVLIGLFDKDHNMIQSIITSDINAFEELSLGTYYIKELETINGYTLDSNEYEVNLEYIDDKTYVVEKSIDIVNKKIKCDIVYISNESLSDIEINVFDEKDNLVFNGITNNEGQVVINNLPYGKYKIKQMKVPKGYILNEEEYTFEINDNMCMSSIDVHNEKTIMPVTSTSIDKCVCIAFLLTSIGIITYVKKNN